MTLLNYVLVKHIVTLNYSKFVLTHSQHILRIHSCSWVELLVTSDVESLATGGASQKKHILGGVTIKCNVKIFKVFHYLSRNNWCDINTLVLLASQW